MSTEKVNIQMEEQVQKFIAPIDIVLLVEGTTDKAFINKLDIEKLLCVPIGDVLYCELYIKSEYKSFLEDYKIDESFIERNSRRSIINIVRGRSKEGVFPQFYGLIDKDFSRDVSEGNILVTPTHDLETFLLSTDDGIFKEPDNITEYLKDSLYYAYLIGIIKKHMREKKIYHKNNNDFEDVLSEEIKLRDLIEFLIDKSKEVTKREILELEKEIKKDIPVDGDGFIDLYKEDVIHNKDIYDIANGHDILSIMKSLCKEQINKLLEYCDTKKHADRAVEFAVIERYNFDVFGRSKLFKDMKKLIPVF